VEWLLDITASAAFGARVSFSPFSEDVTATGQLKDLAKVAATNSQ
jgi:hypothetical protein